MGELGEFSRAPWPHPPERRTHPPEPVPVSAKVALALALALTVGGLGAFLLARVTFGGCSISAGSGLVEMSVRSGMVVVAFGVAAAVSFGIGIGLIAFAGSAGLGRVIVGVVVALVATFFAIGILTVANGVIGHLICRPEAARPQGVTITSTVVVKPVFGKVVTIR